MKKNKGGKHCIRLQNLGALTKKTETTAIAGVKLLWCRPVYVQKEKHSHELQAPSMTGRRVSSPPAGLGATRLFGNLCKEKKRKL